mmetsp:Transcript_20542/g.27070  ORF Transcript_20542/g.27070 Transcript_20542/m.27070 type:complete len:89 (+) Transcript_20542:749-1015(+)
MPVLFHFIVVEEKFTQIVIRNSEACQNSYFNDLYQKMIYRFKCSESFVRFLFGYEIGFLPLAMCCICAALLIFSNQFASQFPNDVHNI